MYFLIALQTGTKILINGSYLPTQLDLWHGAGGVEMKKKQNAGPLTQEDRKLEEEGCTGHLLWFRQG